MKSFKFLILSIGIFTSSFVYSQSDDCASATILSVTATCSSPVAGTTSGATASIAGCAGNADDDVWYKFVATSTSHQITVTPSATFDPVVQLFSGNCTSLTTISCMDNGLNGVIENIYATGLTIGNTYTIRVYNYGTGSGSSIFTICITLPSTPPINNDCSGAINLSVNSTCNYIAGTTVGATQSSVGCSGNSDDDVWFSFVATNSVQTITIDPSSNMDVVGQLFSGTCGALTSLYCIDNSFTNGNEVINAVGLTPTATYFIRVYDYYNATGGAPFDICINGSSTSAPTNDEPCTAIALPAITSACNYLSFTTIGATASTGTAPTPASCGGSSPFIGGFSVSSKDVWFSLIVPATGTLNITVQPGYGIGDGVMALYTGTCSALTQISCSDDNNYPGTANDFKPYISATGLTPGATLYLRYFAYGSGSGVFGLCVSSPTNDACSNALYICDINGYSASTSPAYTPDRPSNMRGNAEVIGTYAYTPGTNTGGIFGQAGPWGSGSAAFDVQINNNSWIKFTASATTASLGVSIFNCWVGNYPSGGMQMQIFSGTNCTNFTPVSDFKENSTGFIITANGLTVGDTYYLMVDGFAGDICNYTITASSGVLFPSITSTSNTLCSGSSVQLTAPVGATSYLWLPGGQTTQNLIDTPSTTTTYTCVVEGVCGLRQTLTKTIVVKPLPILTITSSNTSCFGICDGSVTASATGGTGSYSYLWNDPSSQTTAIATGLCAGSYTVVATDSIGCMATNNVAISQPTILSINTSSNQSICLGDTTIIYTTVSGGTPPYTYMWDSSAAPFLAPDTILVNPTANTTYTVVAADINGCFVSGTTMVSINPSTDIYGHVTYSGGNLNNGINKAVLFNYVPSFIWFNEVQVSTINAAGYYHFTSIEKGDYLIKIFSDTTNYPDLIPTYYTHQSLWDSATVQTHDCYSSDTADVIMIEDVSGTGPGFLSGHVQEGPGFLRIPGDPVPGIDVKLGRNPGGQMITSTQTDASGNYSFSNIPVNLAGEYYSVYVDIPGLERDSVYNVTVTGGSFTFPLLDYEIDSNSVYPIYAVSTSISNSVSVDHDQFVVYPNPTNTSSTVTYSVKENSFIILDVYDILGKKVESIVDKNQQAGLYKVNLPKLKAGLYFITLSINNNIRTLHLVVID